MVAEHVMPEPVDSGRSRRSLLRAVLASLAGLALGALGRPSRAEGAAGGSVVMGASNNAGTSNTSLTTSSTGSALLVTQNSTGTALRGVAGNGIAGFFTSAGGATTIDRWSFSAAAGEFVGSTGIIGQAVSDGLGVVGLATVSTAICGRSISGIGVMGGSDSATAVYGTSDSGAGVYGDSLSSYGVYGSSALSWALYAAGDVYVEGNVFIEGNIAKGSGSFKIDHPLDPANKYLYHSFVESPDMKNVYDGIVALDAKGEATVELPDWFDALNQDFRYQLTPIGPGAPDLAVKSKLAGGRFRIGGGNAGQEVSWQLTGIRKDAFANAHRIPLEEDKPAAERGLYLHPLEHGQPKAKGVATLHPKPTVPARP